LGAPPISSGSSLSLLKPLLSCYCFPDSSLSNSLVEIFPLLRPNGHAIFTSTSVAIFDAIFTSTPFLTGSKALSSDLRFFSFPQTPIPRALNTAFFSFASLPAARFFAYHHRSFGSPSLFTFLRALSRGYIHGIPLLIHIIARKFPPLSLATAYGHFDTLQQGVASTHSPRTGPPPPPYLPLGLTQHLHRPHCPSRSHPPPDPDDETLSSFPYTCHKEE
jgi:hypothetical protein